MLMIGTALPLPSFSHWPGILAFIRAITVSWLVMLRQSSMMSRKEGRNSLKSWEERQTSGSDHLVELQ